MDTMKKIALAALAVLLVLAGCTGGDGEYQSSTVTSPTGSTVSGIEPLSVAERVSVVDAKSGELAAELYSWEIPVGTPYYTDPVRVWVGERSEEAFQSVNTILCLLKNMGYEYMLNKGDYKAQIDMKKCETQNDASGSTEEQSSSYVPNYLMWIINSSRADADSPHLLRAWVDMPMGDQGSSEGLIQVKTVIAESRSEANPVGIFRLDYAGYAKDANGDPDMGQKIMSGFINAVPDPDSEGNVLLRYMSEEDNKSRLQQAVLRRGADSTVGGGSVYSSLTREESGTPVTEEYDFDFAFNDAHFLRRDRLASPVTDYCYSRYVFDENVWRYGLYKYDGSRLRRKSGFSVRYNDGESDYYGWIGYYGMWFPDSVSITNGTTLYRQSYDTGGNLKETAYEAFVAGGRLMKHTRGTVTLGEIKNVSLNYGEWDTRAGTSKEYQVVWDGTSEEFFKTAIKNTTSNYWEEISPPALLNTAGLYSLNFWSEGLGGSVRVDLLDYSTGDNVVLTSMTNATTYIEETAYPGTIAGNMDFVCLNACPDPTAGVINSSTPYYPESTDGSLEYQVTTSPQPGVLNAVTYTFDAAAMHLVDDRSGIPVVLDEPSLASDWGGIVTSALVVNTPSNLELLACDSSLTSTCAWKAWDLPVFYTWQTGPEQWNRLSALTNTVDGSFVGFDQPLRLKYTHLESGHKYYGNTFFLDYAGLGQLQGIPGNCVDKNTGEPVACGPNTGWEPEFSVPTGSELTDKDETSYIAKGLEKEQKMKKLDNNFPCSTPYLDAPVHYTLPTKAEYEEPNLGPAPEVDAPPAIIDGELQAQ